MKIRTFFATAITAALLSSGSALAQDDDKKKNEEDFSEGSVSGGAKNSAINDGKLPDFERTDFSSDSPLTKEEALALPWPMEVHRGAVALGLESEFVWACYQGIEYIYKRDYKNAKSHWDSLNTKYPNRGVGHVGNVLLYQALMLENFDYRYEQQYLFHSQKALEELSDALQKPGEEAWEHFLTGGMIGIESIHTMRRGDFVPALTRGVEAIGHVKKVKELAPKFSDPVLGDGLYKYWKTVVSQNSKLLPDGSDDRVEGISLMRKAESEAVFVGPASTLALVFTWIEEREFNRSLESCMRNRRQYPQNIINSMVMGRVYMYMRKYDNSLKIFDEVLQTAPDNMRVHYYKATTFLRKRDYDSAELAIDKYLAFELEPEFKAAGLHRKGDIYYRRKEYKKAEKLYKEAVKVNDYEPSKARLKRIKKLKKEGKI